MKRGKEMKKVLSVIFAAIMMFSSCALFAFAKEEETVPVVVLQGYSGPNLVYVDENGDPIIDPETDDVVKAWPLDFDKIGQQVLDALPEMVAGKVVGEDAIVEAITPILKEALMPLVILEDGSSWQPLDYYPKGAAATQVSTLLENDMEQYIPESIFVEEAISHVGAENVFGFTFDWRRSQLDYAAALDKYIEDVKEITGSDKVDIMGLSHGGQYGTTYLYYYGDKGNVRNAILANPATGGTTVVSSLLMKEYIDTDLQEIMKFIQYSFDMEEDYDWIFQLLALDNIKGGINRVVKDERIWYRASNFPSFLDFIPMDRFDEVIDYINLDPVKNEKIYNDTVKYHTDVHTGTNLADKLAQLQENGTKIGYIVGCGYAVGSAVGNNSDILIDTYLSSGGATCAPFGETFAADYVQKGTVCDDPTHYHISPGFNIDASTGALPDSTWYAIGQGHGQYFNEPYTRQIVINFLWDDLKTVYDDDRFPQFNYTQKHSDSVYVSFNNTDAGYHSSADTEMIIRNLSNTSKVHIWNIKFDGVQLDYSNDENKVLTLDVGESISLNLSEISPESAETPFKVIVKYSLDNTQKTYVEKVFDFTGMSDEEMKLYPHLAKKIIDDEIFPTPEVPTESNEPETEEPIKPQEPETEINTEKPSVDEPTTGESKEPVTDVEIPNTDSLPIRSVAIALGVCGVALVTTTVILKKKED